MEILHTMVRVKDLDRSVKFYTELLGMQVYKKKDYPAGEFTLVFVGYSETGPTLELTYNWDGRDYELGTGYGHIAISTDRIYELCKEIEEKGGKVPRQPGPMKGSNSVIAFAEDPDGYKIELIQR